METTAPAALSPTQLIDLAKVDLPDDARLHDPVEIELLAKDMARNGQLQEIILIRRGDRYEVVAGVGRVLAAGKVGLPQVRAQVREDLSDFQKAAITFSENEHRENTDPVYQAYQLDKMQKARSCSQRELAAAVGLPETRISEYLSLATLKPEVRKNLQRCKFSRAHLVEISRLSTLEQQLAIGQRCQKEDLSLRALKILIDSISKKTLQEPKVTEPPAEFRFVQKPGGVAVTAFWDQGKGDEEAFLARLRGALRLWVSQHAGKEGKTTAKANPKNEVDFSAMTAEQVLEYGKIIKAGMDPKLRALYELGEKAELARRAAPAPQSTPPPQNQPVVKPPMDPKLAAMIARRKAQRILP